MRGKSGIIIVFFSADSYGSFHLNNALWLPDNIQEKKIPSSDLPRDSQDSCIQNGRNGSGNIL